MTISALKLAGNFLYFIGALILIPVGAIFLGSVNTLMMAEPVVLQVPILGIVLTVAGKWLKHKALRLEEIQSEQAKVSYK